jgi:DNA-binding transcriptional MerR regulator
MAEPLNDNGGLEGRLTVEQLARRVGMSPRNIRAHQARGLLPPPIRHGRTAFYDASHVRRLEAVVALQRQGFNLFAIAAILGVRAGDPAAEALTALLQRLAVVQPALIQTLQGHGVVMRGEDGAVRLTRPRAVRSALELNRAGVAPAGSLQVLAEVLDGVRQVAAELVRTTSARLMALAPELTRAGLTSWEEYDRDSVALTQGLTGLLTEAFRVAVENVGRDAVADLIAQRIDVDLQLTNSAVVDAG